MINSILKFLWIIFITLAAFSIGIILLHYGDETYSFDLNSFINDLVTLGNNLHNNYFINSFYQSLEFSRSWVKVITDTYQTNAVLGVLVGITSTLPMLVTSIGWTVSSLIGVALDYSISFFVFVFGLI